MFHALAKLCITQVCCKRPNASKPLKKLEKKLLSAGVNSKNLKITRFVLWMEIIK